jgi:FMN phosphatase YigB (HAD superfamily)
VRPSRNQLNRLVELDVRGRTRINQAVLDLMLRLHAAGIRPALLSNLPADYRSYFTRHFPWLERFSALVCSCDVGGMLFLDARSLERELGARLAGVGF